MKTLLNVVGMIFGLLAIVATGAQAASAGRAVGLETVCLLWLDAVAALGLGALLAGVESAAARLERLEGLARDIEAQATVCGNVAADHRARVQRAAAGEGAT
jgi:hypothetical protein